MNGSVNTPRFHTLLHRERREHVLMEEKCLARTLVGCGEERGVHWGHGKLLRQNSETTEKGGVW